MYRLLIDFYDKNETPLPASFEEICDEIGARSKPEKAAVHKVLRKYFQLMNDGYHNQRCDEDILAYHNRRDKNAENGGKGGRPKNPSESDEKPNGLSNETQNKATAENSVSKNNLPHEPRTTNHEPVIPPAPLWENFSDPTARLVAHLEAGRPEEFTPGGGVRVRVTGLERGWLVLFFQSYGEERVHAAIDAVFAKGYRGTREQVEAALKGKLNELYGDRGKASKQDQPSTETGLEKHDPTEGDRRRARAVRGVAIDAIVGEIAA